MIIIIIRNSFDNFVHISALKSELKKTQNDRDQLKAQLKSLNDTLR